MYYNEIGESSKIKEVALILESLMEWYNLCQTPPPKGQQGRQLNLHIYIKRERARTTVQKME